LNELELHAWREGYRLGYYQGVRDGSSEAHKLTADEQARRIAEGMTTAEQQQLNLSGEKAQEAHKLTADEQARGIAEGMTTAEQQQLNLSGEKAQGAWPITRPARPRRKP